MGILDFLKTKWSAGEMTEEDRKKVFWYLKRKTSYTAWKREADAFDIFAEIFEKQLKEEPTAKPTRGLEATEWEGYYTEVLRCQVFYEKGLAQLKQGDRTVWLYNERGFLHEAWGGHDWHSKIVAGMYGKEEIQFDGKYVPEMRKALQDFFSVTQDTGYLQPTMEDVGMPDTFYPEKFDAYAPLSRQAVIFPAYLPDVPEPDEEILVRTGEEVPVFGIYEPQIKDGCMNYLHGGTTARPYDMALKRPVTWRLIWEDTRYLDGHVSNEEDQYFPFQSKPIEATPVFVGSDLISASTGQICPKAGKWAVMNDLQGVATLDKGERMPKHDGRDVVWVWGS